MHGLFYFSILVTIIMLVHIIYRTKEESRRGKGEFHMIDFNQTIQGILRLRTAFKSMIDGKGGNFGLISLINTEAYKPQAEALQVDKQLELFEEENSKSKNENGGDNNMSEMNFNDELRNLAGGCCNNQGNQCTPCNASNGQNHCCIPCIPCIPCDSGLGGLEGLEVCGMVNRSVTACATEVIPSGIALVTGAGTSRVLFDIRNLRCEVVRCALVENNVVVGARFSVRIVGNLPFISSITIRSDATGICTEPDNSTAFLCFSGSANVNNVIAQFDTQAAAEAFCTQAITCGRIVATISNPVISGAVNSCGDRLVNYTVTFTFTGR